MKRTQDKKSDGKSVIRSVSDFCNQQRDIIEMKSESIGSSSRASYFYFQRVLRLQRSQTWRCEKITMENAYKQFIEVYGSIFWSLTPRRHCNVHCSSLLTYTRLYLDCEWAVETQMDVSLAIGSSLICKSLKSSQSLECSCSKEQHTSEGWEKERSISWISKGNSQPHSSI